MCSCCLIYGSNHFELIGEMLGPKPDLVYTSFQATGMFDEGKLGAVESNSVDANSVMVYLNSLVKETVDATGSQVRYLTPVVEAIMHVARHKLR